MVGCPGFAGRWSRSSETVKGTSVSVENNLPDTAGAGARDGEPTSSNGHLTVSELVSERPAAPSPFGDDQTFPLPVDRLNYIPSTPA
jgi:hypothetical protein